MPSISLSAVARGTAYALQAGKPLNTTDNLPQRIAILAEVNDANAEIVSYAPFQVTSRVQAANIYGWGSPIDIICRILFPEAGGGVNGIPVWIYPQLASHGVAQVWTVTITGTATAADTHTALIAGRTFLEGGSYTYNIANGDTPSVIATTLADTINAVLGCPLTASNALGVVTLTANWSSLSSAQATINMLVGADPSGVSYAVAEDTAASGLPLNQDAFDLFDTDWNTIIVDSHDLRVSNIDEILAFNGNADRKTGQWSPMVFQPGLYFVGTTEDTTPGSTCTIRTDFMMNEMSICGCPAPLSLGFAMEAAANYVVLFAAMAQNTPNGDIETMVLPDMPQVYSDITGLPQQSSNWNMRDAIVKLGMSTVIYNNGSYYVQDFVTTYHPQGINQPAWRYARDVNIDFNVRYKFTNLQASVIGTKQIANDDDVVSLPNVVKPKDVRGALVAFASSLVAQGLCTDAKAMVKTINVVINPSNINRFDIAFGYNRSGVVRIVDTLATANP